MEQLSVTNRIKLEADIRNTAIGISHTYGIAGVEFFINEFSLIAREYVKAIEVEKEFSFANLSPKEA